MEDEINSYDLLKVFSEPQRLFLIVIRDYPMAHVKTDDPYLVHLAKAAEFHNKSVKENLYKHCAWNCPLNATTTVGVFVSDAMPETFIFMRNEEETNETKIP